MTGSTSSNHTHMARFGRALKNVTQCGFQCTAAIAVLCATGAFAQEADTASNKVEELIITGSRVIRNGDASPSPTTIVSTERILDVQPGQLNDALQILPVFAGSRGSGSNPSATGVIGSGNGSANQLNLRNMGINRTLPLLDGKRLPPSLMNGNVDVDIVPQMLVDRVDIVTGGVSAVYGSDAVTGVVNYVINKDYEGVKFHMNKGISDRSDGEKDNFGIAFGTDAFDGRGHFIGSYEYRNEEGVLRRSDRDWMRQAGITGRGSEANPYENVQDIRHADYAFGGLIRSGVLEGQTFKSNGVLTPFVHGQPTGNAAIEIGGDGAYFDSSLIQPMQSDQLFGRFDFELTDDLDFYVQASANIKENRNYGDYVILNREFIKSDNAFLPQEYQDILAGAGEDTFRYSMYMADAPRRDTISEADQRVYMTGLSGTMLDGNYDWGVDVVHGETELRTILNHNTNFRKLAAAMDAVIDPTSGEVVCNVTLTNPGALDDCIPLNLFGPTAGNDAAYDFIAESRDWVAEYEQTSISGYISGSPFELPAGTVNMAVSADWRDTSVSAVSDVAPDLPFDCTGIEYNCNDAPRLLNQTLPDFPEASEAVWEVAAEFDAPLFGDIDGAGFNLNGAVRKTDYEVSGGYTTWKLGFDWRLSDALRLRGTSSRDIRAPSLYELFFPENSNPVSDTDLLTGLSPTVLSTGGGNPDLTAEKGETSTIGMVWQPTSNLSVALDYYNIVVKNALQNVNGRNAGTQQICYDSGGSHPYCALQERPNGYTDTSPSNVVTEWYQMNINVAEQETSGFDLEVNYGTSLFDRPLDLRLMAAYQPHVYYRQPDQPTRDQGGVAWGPLGAAAGPAKRATLFARYQMTDNLSLDLMQRWRDALKVSGFPDHVFAPGEDTIDSFTYTNLNLNYSTVTAMGDTSLFFNVSNVFDRNPPTGGYTSNGTRAGYRDGYPSGDNPMGRYFTIGISVSM